ncbi:MAG TPA: superoxide dismutase family protein [Anaerolineae bacterium]|nr:superoxide dismutase family protein [Anaerolineae bacterium]
MLKLKNFGSKVAWLVGGGLALVLIFSALPYLARTENSQPTAGRSLEIAAAQDTTPTAEPTEDQVDLTVTVEPTGEATDEVETTVVATSEPTDEFAGTVEPTGEATGEAPATVTVTVEATPGTTPTLTGTVAMAELQNITGTVIGTAHFTDTAEGVQIRVDVSGFTEASPGEHGIHFHQVGRCTPDFAVAQGHFNPTGAKHGLENPMGPHAGDLPNIEFDEEGNATYTTTTTLVALPALLAADGSALIIHSQPDDQMTDPAGRSGSRIACGVLMSEGTSPPEAEGPPPPIQGNNVEPELRSATEERIAQLQAPDGFQIDVFGEGLGSVRMMAQGEDGTVYVTRRQQGDVLALRDDNEDGLADEPVVVASDLELVHGIIIDGNQIYLATATTIYVGSLGADGTAQNLSALVNDLPPAGQHGNRTIAFGPDGMLYVSVGSPCNACASANLEYATILQVQPDGSSRTLFAEGLRNTIGWGWHPETGEMWGMDHGSDWRGDDQPPEELNSLSEGRNYGWPYCYANQQVDPYLPVSPPGLTKAEFCAGSAGPVLTYQAHSAPIGMVFYTGSQFPEIYQNDAFVAMRGSWNRQEPVGYKVVRLDFDENGQPVGFEDFVTGWLTEDGTAQFGRVAGLLVLQDGSLLISDDTNGMIYRVSYAGEQ